MPLEPIEPIIAWFNLALHNWYEESTQDEEYEILNNDTGLFLGSGSSIVANRTWTDAVFSTGPKPELWTLIPNKSTLLNDYLQNLSLQFAKKERQLEQTNTQLEERFTSLAEQWRNETAHISSITKQVMNFNYQRIIGMGPAVLPILFRELERKPSYWFWALEAITGENPTHPEDIGDVKKMAESWLDWARTRGYLNVSSARILLRQFAEQQL